MSKGGKVQGNVTYCGKSVSWYGVAIGTGFVWCRIGTSEPAFGEDQSCSLGRIALRVPMS